MGEEGETVKAAKTGGGNAASAMSSDILGELVKVNVEAGDDSLKIDNKIIAFIEPLADEKDEWDLLGKETRKTSNSLGQETATPRLQHDQDVETDYDLESALASNVVNSDLMTRIFRSTRSSYHDFEIDASAKRVLSEGIQMHLKNVVEAAFRLAQSRVNRQSYEDHAKLLQTMKQCTERNNYDALSKVAALQWGPNVTEILAREEAAAQEYMRKFQEMDEHQLVEKMKNFDEESSKQQTNGPNKSKRTGAAAVSDQDTWFKKEVGCVVIHSLRCVV